MHRGCFVRTPKPALSGRRTPRPGPVLVCVGQLLLAGSGVPASRARFGAPHLFLWPVSLRSLFARRPPGWGCPVCGCCCFFSPVCAPVVSGIPCAPDPGALGLGVLWALRLPSALFSLPPPPSPFFSACLSFIFCVFCFFFPLPLVFLFFFSALLCRFLRYWGGLCVLGCGVFWCVLLWALCPGRGRFAVALCRAVLPRCAYSLCAVAGRVACVRWRHAGGVPLPRAVSGALLVCFVLWSCSAPLPACLCPWVLWWGCPVARGLVVLIRLALVSVVLVSVVWSFALSWSAVRCCAPPAAPSGCCPLLSFCRVYAGCADPPPRAAGCGALCFALSRVVSCGAAVCGCLCSRSSCTPPILIRLCGVGVCAWARVSATPRHSWLGCWDLCVIVSAILLYPTTPGWGVRCGCVCVGSGFGCAPPFLAGSLGCVCLCLCSACTPPFLAGVCGLAVCA